MSVQVSNEELLTSLQGLLGSDSVSMSDLERPTSEFMMRYFVTALNGMGIDVKAMMDRNELQNLPSADSYKYMLPFNVVFNAVWKVYPLPRLLAGFSLLSLMEPSPGDISYVSLFDNFFNFWTSRVESVLGPRLRNIDLEQQELKEQKQLREELQHKLNNFAAERSKRVVEQAQVEEKLQVLEVEEGRLQIQEQKLEGLLEEKERAIKEIRSEVESNRLKMEQQAEHQELEAECRRLKEELQKLQGKQEEQDSLLRARQAALQDKASRKQFLENAIAQEEQVTLAVVKHLELASSLETHMDSVGDCKKKLESVLKNTESEKTVLQNKESHLKDLENEIASAEKEHADLVKESHEHDSVFQRFSEVSEEIASYEAKCTELRQKILEKQQEFSVMEKRFQEEQEKMVKKAESMATFFKEKMNQSS